MKLFFNIWLILLGFSTLGNAQILLKTYHDDEKTALKEEFYIRSKKSNILEGPYTSYNKAGGIMNEGQFSNNKSTGVWKYYYDNGRLRMRGQISDGKNVGQWDYFYENGAVKMSGRLVDGEKDGVWIYYYKNELKESEGSYTMGSKIGIWKYYSNAGVLKATEEFSGEGSYYEELFEAGSTKLKGNRVAGKKVGLWLYYYEDGTVKARGEFEQDKKTGNWKFFDNSSKIEAEGKYDKDLASGIWQYYHPDGSIASKGELFEGIKDGNWKLFYNDGTIKGEANYNRGDGEYKEYYRNGATKIQGMVKEGHNNERWQYYYEKGEIEGTCDFIMGDGEYLGYYKDGTLKMKGKIKNDLKIGIWELYERTGEIAGYYKPYYEDGESTFFLADDNKEQKELSQRRRARAGSSKTIKKKSRYFKKKIHEYKAIILGYNPLAPLLGVLPVSVEYYLEERQGFELAAQYLRNPFFRSLSSINDGDIFSEGYALTLKQKYYHKEVPIGQPYFAHELKYSSINHSTNIASDPILGAIEQKIEYGITIGTRYFKNVSDNGFTADAFVGFGIGYRNYEQSYVSIVPLIDPFNSINSNKFAYAIRLGINIGYAFRVMR